MDSDTAGEIFNVGSTERVTIGELAERVHRAHRLELRDRLRAVQRGLRPGDRGHAPPPARDREGHGRDRLEADAQPRRDPRRRRRVDAGDARRLSRESSPPVGPCPAQSRARSAGKSITSRIDSLPVKSIASRSMPSPMPPVGRHAVRQRLDVVGIAALGLDVARGALTLLEREARASAPRRR